MIDDCINLGTIPFSILARHGFIAKTILNSLKNMNIFSIDEINHIQGCVETVASELVDDMSKLQKGMLKNDVFMKKYGHLRPGTYDIMSNRYDQMSNFIKKGSDEDFIDHSKFSKFVPSKDQTKKIDKLLKENNFKNFNTKKLLQYVNDAIIGREYGKFVFTKTLSNMLELIGAFAEDNNLSRDEISHVPIDKLLRIEKNSLDFSIEDYLREISKKESEKNEISCCIRLPQLITDISGAYIVPFQVSHPNFITNKKITAASVVLHSNSEGVSVSLKNKIVVIEGADPGFDWIFSQKIAGLITKYGGANSHMAIRCAEFGIPAAIGCGEQRFDMIVSGNKVHLDCAADLVMSVH